MQQSDGGRRNNFPVSHGVSYAERVARFNRYGHFRFAVRGRVIMLAAMAHRKLIPCASILTTIGAFAADQTASAIADKGKQTLEWWKERVGHLI
ncbi:MAG: hypothetical protein DME26_03830, partial [Verrucomicrobia bacterium]